MNDKMSKGKSLIPVERIERSILLIRGHIYNPINNLTLKQF